MNISQNRLSLKDFVSNLYKNLHKKPSNLRDGQFLMSELHKIRPELYLMLTNTDEDCYYDDSIISKTLLKLEENW